MHRENPAYMSYGHSLCIYFSRGDIKMVSYRGEGALGIFSEDIWVAIFGDQSPFAHLCIGRYA